MARNLPSKPQVSIEAGIANIPILKTPVNTTTQEVYHGSDPFGPPYRKREVRSKS